MISIRDIIRAEEYGVSEKLLRQRIWKGIPKEEAITTPNYSRETKKWREIAEKNGLPRRVFYDRIYRLGWEYERAANEPLQINKHFHKWRKIAEQNGINKHTFNTRINKLGWNYERAATTPPYNKLYEEHQKWQKVALENGIKKVTFNARVTRYGWDYKKAATTPVAN